MSFRFFQIGLALSAWLIALTAAAQSTPAYQWAGGAWASVEIQSGAVAVSPNGDVFTAYSYTGTASIGGQTYPAPSGSPSFTLRYNTVLIQYGAAGQVKRNLLLARSSYINAVETDQAGNVYALGRFNQQVRAGTQTITGSAPNCSDLFIGKWDSTGALQWLKQGVTLSPLNLSYVSSDFLTVDDSANVTISGALSHPLTIGSTTLTPAPGIVTPFCLQLKGADGDVRWSRISAAAPGFEYFSSMAVEAATGELVLVGESNGTFEWGGQFVGGGANDSIFWMRMSADGALLASFAAGLPTALPRVAADAGGYTFLSFINIPYAPATTNLNGASVTYSLTAKNNATIARLDPQGVPQWVRVIEFDSSFFYPHVLKTVPHPASVASPVNLCYLKGQYIAPTQALSLGGTSLPSNGNGSGHGGEFVAALDALTGQTVWAVNVSSASVTGLSIADNGQVVVSGPGGIRFGPIVLTAPGPGLICALTGKLLQNYNQIQGTAFVDTDGDGTQDAGDAPFDDLIVECQPEGTYFNTAPNGAYSAITELGTHSVSLAAPPPYYTLGTTPAPATFTTFGNIATGRDFALQPIPNQQDLQVFVTPVTFARPGFPLFYHITYRNIGTTTESGTVTVALDPRLTYQTNTGGGTLSGSTLTVAYAGLAPRASRAFRIQFQVPTTVDTGTVLLTSAVIEPVATDLTPADNAATDSLTVTGSYDPNDVAVNWARLTPAQVTAGEWLEYTIRFENTGTDTAFSVLLRDSLPAAQLDLGTLQPLAWSHNCTYQLAPDGWLSVQFSNIRLPYRNINALGSTGFVRFRVKPMTTLVLGDIVPNQAGIYFDFNAPVITNTALTTVQNSLGLGAEADGTLAVSVWPNPTDGTLNVESAAGAGPLHLTLHLTLLDNVGRTVRTLIAPDSRRVALDVRGLPAGLYLLRGQGAEGGASFTRRVVVR